MRKNVQYTALGFEPELIFVRRKFSVNFSSDFFLIFRIQKLIFPRPVLWSFEKYEIGWPLKIKKGLNNALEPKALIKLAQNCGMSKQRKKSL